MKITTVQVLTPREFARLWASASDVADTGGRHRTNLEDDLNRVVIRLSLPSPDKNW